jgi:hypothetical protein
MNAELEGNKIVEKFGSKIYQFVKFAQETLDKDPDAKIILFI